MAKQPQEKPDARAKRTKPAVGNRSNRGTKSASADWQYREAKLDTGRERTADAEESIFKVRD
jgi:hypothetical protein